MIKKLNNTIALATLLTISVVIFLLPSLIKAADITVVVTGIKNDVGKINIALDNSEQNYDIDNKAERGVFVFATQVNAKPDKVRIVIPDIDTGEYVVSVFHDENDNQVIDTNFFGVPTEGYAFSNNVVGVFSKPTFEETKFSVDGNKAMTLNIKLNY